MKAAKLAVIGCAAVTLAIPGWAQTPPPITPRTGASLGTEEFLLAVTDPASADVCRYENLMPAFLEFERETKDLTPTQRANLFINKFARQNRAFYDEVGRVEGDNGFPPAAKLRKNALGLLDPARMEVLPGFAPLTQARFEAVARATGPDFDQAQPAFLRAFPDFPARLPSPSDLRSCTSTVTPTKIRAGASICYSASMLSP